MNIKDIKREVIPACTEFEVQKLFVFGSFARSAESPSSDVDLLVEFNFSEDSFAKRYFGLLHRLEDTLESSIDLLTDKSLRNPHFRKRVLEERVLIYAKC
ncbi:MAG: nucleotidyltransferase domain-containing protein [Candidatus Sabulitectum sp.]|nr:nucleotidyltransferase domain-containing protein [Candidatus Sabulitectum sp.]